MKTNKIDNWAELIEHVNSTWKKRKQVDFTYPFRGKDFKDLKNSARNFGVFRLMGLWKVYIDSDNEWINKSGYSISGFYSCLPWLIDNPNWKGWAAKYEQQIIGPYKEIAGVNLKEVIKTGSKGVSGKRMDKVAQKP